jgi:hypothetical protein
MTATLASPRPETADAPATPRPTTDRLRFVDHLRVALTALVVLHHLAITYGIAIGWYYMEVSADELVNLSALFFLLFNQAYFMSLFFLLAAYFTPASYERKGARGFLQDRGLRLGLPLLAFTFVIGPIAALWLYFTYARDTGPYWRYYLSSTGTGVAWFIAALLLFSLGYALWRRFAKPTAGQQRADAAPPAARLIIAFTLGLTLVSYLARIPFSVGYFAPWINFQFGYFPQYLAFFGVGLLAYRRNWLATIPARAGSIGFVAAIGATVVCLPLALVSGEAAFGGGSWQSLVYSLWDSTVAVGMALALVTFFRARFNSDGPVWGALSGGAYTVYLIHPLVLVAVGLAFSGITAHPFAKYALAAVIALPLCFGLAAALRRLPFARRIL